MYSCWRGALSNVMRRVVAVGGVSLRGRGVPIGNSKARKKRAVYPCVGGVLPQPYRDIDATGGESMRARAARSEHGAVRRRARRIHAWAGRSHCGAGVTRGMRGTARQGLRRSGVLALGRLRKALPGFR